MDQSIGVWLICVDGENKGKIVLQQRAETDGVRRQSHPFICQPTINGKVNPSESLKQAIVREARRELGDEFVNTHDFERLTPFYSGKYKDNGKRGKSHGFLGLVSEKELKLIKLHREALPEFIFVSSLNLKRKEVKCFLEHPDPTKNIDPRNDVVLFRDQWRALETLFELKEKLEAWS